MSQRKTIFANGEYYHVFNRSVQKIPIFKGQRESDLFLEAAYFYLQINPPTKFALYRKNRSKFSVNYDSSLVDIINYVLMPNHFHFTLKQNCENGIKKFLQRLTNSFAHYFNIKYNNHGPLFERNFKAVHIEDTEQLVYLSSYIHLNPVTAYLVEYPEDYFYSSYRTYLNEETNELIKKSIVLSEFSNVSAYKNFVMDNKNYERILKNIKHLTIDENTRS